MKIAQVNVYFYPFLVGGAEWYVYNISRELVKRGHEVHVYTSNDSLGKQAAPAQDVVDGINVHRVPLWLNLTYRSKIWKGLGKFLLNEEFDVIHTYDYAQFHSYVATKIGQKAGIPTLLTVFDVHSMIPRPFYKSFPLKIFDKYLARFTLKKANRILVRAPNLVESLIKMGADEHSIRVTPSGIVEDALKRFDGEDFRRKYGISNAQIILFLGRLNPLKGPQFLIMAANDILKKHPNALFVFVGPDQGNYKNFLIKLAKKRKVNDHLIFTGPIYDFKTKMQAYAAADVFVLPSGYEGTSQAIFEAMAQARPIVATNRGGIPFQVENGKEAVLIDYGDFKALAEAVSRLLEDREFALRLGLRAKEKVKEFTYPLLANQIEELYNEVAKR